MLATHTFSKLKSKYENFAAPTVRITVDGVEIREKLGAKFSSVTVSLSSDYEASGCSFDVMYEYDTPDSDFLSRGSARLLQLGAKVDVELGYVKTIPVFRGVLTEIQYNFDDENKPVLHVDCLDAKFLLMKQQSLIVFSEKTITDVFAAMFRAQPFASYVTQKNVVRNGQTLPMLPAVQESDYQFITRWAQYLGYEFFIQKGAVYVRQEPTSGSPLIGLTSQDGCISSLHLTLSGTGLVKKTVVCGIDPENGKEVSGEASLTGRFGQGRSPSQMISQSVKRVFDHQVTSASQAKARATLLMQQAKDSFGTLHCTCQCLPEILPGHWIQIKGFGKQVDRVYYITDVEHRFDESSFVTQFSAKVDSL